MEIADLNLSVRTFNAVCRAEIKTVPQLYDMYQCDSEKLRLLVGNKHFEEIGDALAKHREAVWEENRKADESAAAPNPAVIVSESYTRAVSLTRAIIANAQAAQQSLYEVCKGLKEMRDGKLYKELGYQNFADFCENEVGIHRNQAMKYASIAEIENAQLTGHFEKIGTEKLYLLAKLDEPTRQEVTETIDVESVTVKELKAQITALTAERDENEHAAKLLSDKLDSAKESLASKDKQFKEAMESKDRQIKAAKESGEKSLSDCKAYLNGRIHELEDHIKEMENAPIDHDMTDADAAEEIKRLKRELEDEQLRYTVLEGSVNARTRKAAEEVRAEYEKKLADLQNAEKPESAPDSKAVFKAYLANAADALTRLMDFLEASGKDENLPFFLTKLDGIVEMTQTRRNAL